MDISTLTITDAQILYRVLGRTAKQLAAERDPYASELLAENERLRKVKP